MVSWTDWMIWGSSARLDGPLERQGWVVLHDLAIPGSRANLDHLVIGPGGVFVVDSKRYRGRLQLDPSGQLWHGRYSLTAVLRTVSFEADRAAQVLADPQVVVPIVAVHGAQVPWGKVVTQGVPVVSARRLPSMLRTSRRCWDPNGSPPWPTKLESASGLPLTAGTCHARQQQLLR